MADLQKVLLVEEYRLALMNAVYQKIINKKPPQKIEEKNQLTNSTKERIKRFGKIGLLFFAGVVGAVEMGVWTYYGSVAAVTALLPTIISMLIIPFCAVFTVVSVLQFISFEMDQVKQLFGISSTSTSQKILTVIKEQIKCAKKINQALDNRHIYARLTQEHTYENFHAAASLFNMDIENRRKNFEEYRESKSRKAFRYTVTAFGVLLALIETYFGTSLLLSMISASLVGTPIASVITALIMASTVVLYFSMRGSGLASLFNRDQEESKKVKEALSKFEQPLEIKKRISLESQLEKKLETKSSKIIAKKPLEKSCSLSTQGIFYAATQNVVKAKEAIQQLRPVY